MTILEKALADFPYSHLKIFPCPYTEIPDDILDARECTFNPRHLIEGYFSEKVPYPNNLWGWGLVEVEKPEDGEDVKVRAFFDVANPDDLEDRIYPEPKGFWGLYDSATSRWSFHFGR